LLIGNLNRKTQNTAAEKPEVDEGWRRFKTGSVNLKADLKLLGRQRKEMPFNKIPNSFRL
tara:strand:+ start:311 stop:490 length:180 start_codon:yes stop_codon:yes gene_type:complete